MKVQSRIKTGYRAYTREFRDPDRWQAFFHNRLWIGLPVAPVVLFLAGYLQRSLGEGIPVGTALAKGAIDAALGAFCYILGIWASTAPDEKKSEEEEPSSGRYDWRGRLLAVGLMLAGLALFCSHQIHNIWVGDGSFGRNLGIIFLKLVCIAVIFIPAWIVEQRK